MGASIGRVGARWYAGMLVAFLTAGCGGEDGGAAPAVADRADAPPPAAPPRQLLPVDPATAATLAGAVRFTGPVPEARTIRMLGEAFCLRHYPPDGTVVDASLQVSDGKLANAFVWIVEGLDGWRFDDPAGPVVLDQRGCLYEPRVLGVRTGQTLQILNSDPVLHNVHSKPRRNREKNSGMPPATRPRDLVFKRSEVMVPFVCDVHSWMRAWVGVVDHPFFAVTGADGAWRLEGLPPGEYVVEAWHEVLGTQRTRVTVAPGQDARAGDLVFGGP